MENKTEVSWRALLSEAVQKPGLVSEAYGRFWNYSLGNQMLAMFQCSARNLEPGPIATYPRWQELGRHVKRGEKAIELCMPVTCKRKDSVTNEAGAAEEKELTFTRFIYRRNWFVLAQTEGQPYIPPAIPDWDRARAIAQLNVTEEVFSAMNGNAQGYAQTGRKFAINPVAEMPHKTTFHELGHIMLGHCEEGNLSDSDNTPRNLREAEAESVALLCCESLGLPGAEFSRGYIQNWLDGAEIPERSAQKIFHAADEILKAGRPQTEVKS